VVPDVVGEASPPEELLLKPLPRHLFSELLVLTAPPRDAAAHLVDSS